jgi:hypothetical protein
VSRTRWYGAQVKAKERAAAAAGLRAAAEMVFDASQQVVPEDTGGLKRSGDLTVDEGKLRAVISYGQGLPDPRAVITHEKLDIRHDNGEAKYLEGPLTALADQARGVIASSIRRTLG